MSRKRTDKWPGHSFFNDASPPAQNFSSSKSLFITLNDPVMKSSANIKGHPIHPILVGFPIAFFTGALFFDALAYVGTNGFAQTGKYLIVAGLIAAFFAAIPGFIDFLFTVPPQSSAKKRAAKHGLTNIAALAFFAAALIYRTQTAPPAWHWLLLLEAGGLALLTIAGWMGGTLVYRNQIGVNPRYAAAGRWKEESLQAPDGKVTVDDIHDLKLNQMRLIHAAGKRIVVAHTENGYMAFSDHCTHRGGSLAGGAIICGTVQCPWHGSQFNVQSGAVKAGPADQPIVVYAAVEHANRLTVDLNQRNPVVQ